ncbi:MAG: DAK2 domain-containing protein [Candidatus Heimdallarchaeota archaeon]|nr:DAK2 domain-containing protein [Candidatus Heimdallarchaeota archaeon]
MEALTGPLLKEMILESFQRINEKVDYLNDINVFPVPDGDTGLNLYITLSRVVEELDKHDFDLTVKEAAKSIAKGAFAGAKGNSGVILSQFFIGFSKTIEDEPHITTEIFANALVKGSERAYKAVMNPREGTILSVLRETAEAAINKAQTGGTWREVVEHCYEIAQQSTLETPNLLEDLKKAGVVDAGALGFVYLIQGWLFVIANTIQGPKVIDIKSNLENLHNNVDVNLTLEDLQYRYCTEGLLINPANEVEKMEIELKTFGDSFLLISNDNSYKLHVHTNNPSEALLKFSSYGQLQAAKIDDMKAQTMFSHET